MNTSIKSKSSSYLNSIQNEIVPLNISEKIIRLPGRPEAMLDKDLAKIYEVETGALNRAMKRNLKRFPDRFVFQATDIETDFLRCQSVMSRKSRTANPHLYTREGANMLSAVLTSDRAIERSIQIMIGFSELEEKKLLTITKERDEKIEALNDAKPYIEYAKAIETSKGGLLVQDWLPIARQNGFDFGRNQFLQLLRDHGYLYRQGKRNTPTKKATTLGVIALKFNLEKGYISTTPVITGKGQRYFLEKLKNNPTFII